MTPLPGYTDAEHWAAYIHAVARWYRRTYPHMTPSLAMNETLRENRVKKGPRPNWMDDINDESATARYARGYLRRLR